MWQRGSSTNPDSRYERVSVLTWKVGGFADEFPNMDNFVANMKDNPKTAKEFRSAYAEMVKLIEEGKMRFRAAEKDGSALRLQEARKTVVKQFQQSHLEVRTKFRGIKKDVYEKMHPGRIVAKNMKVMKIKADGVMSELVLVPKLPEGEYDVDGVDLAGVVMEDEIDNGEASITELQQQKKFVAAANVAMGGARASAQNRDLEAEAAVEEAEDVRVDSDAEQPAESNVESNEEDDDLMFVRKSVFGYDQDDESQAGKPQRVAPSLTSRGAAATAKTVKPSETSSGRPRPLPKLLGKAKLSSPAKPGPAATQATDEEHVALKKFEGKTMNEILAKHGLTDILAKVELTTSALASKALSTVVNIYAETFSTAFGEFKKVLGLFSSSLVFFSSGFS
jgi:hypothetical protein